ncbi:hypothetical protein CTI12_AA050260 [Artemisia annua]|uniref:Uncharacterized protein n=1 Tax=Artemisia annua TaxID=35608 RepID=A0A2U1QBQ4_ARTAN|nr:hypothetical protein CTI12_AA050260 [Artemisia annua]
MEIEQRTPLISKKLWSIIRTLLYMMKKNISKNIPWFELHMLLKKTTKIATKLLLEHQTLTNTLTCRPNNIHDTFIPPRDYQFSCSSTPVFNPKRKSYYRRKSVHDHDHAHALTETVDENGVQVDKKADEFIKNFYKELKMQKKRAAIEPPTPSPSRYQWWNEVR